MCRNSTRLLLIALLAAFSAASAAFAEEARETPKGRLDCASLSGAWSGSFDGSAHGSWIARFRQTGDRVTATARILVVGAGGLEASGTAELTCRNGVLELEGSGSAGRHVGSFSGFAQANGKYVLGNWSSGRLSGNWNGERAQGDTADGILPP